MTQFKSTTCCFYFRFSMFIGIEGSGDEVELFSHILSAEKRYVLSFPKNDRNLDSNLKIFDLYLILFGVSKSF